MTYYGKYDKLFDGLEDKPMLDNDEIKREAIDTKNGGDARDVEEVGNEKGTEDERDNKTARNNDRVTDREDQKDSKKSNDEWVMAKTGTTVGRSIMRM